MTVMLSFLFPDLPVRNRGLAAASPGVPYTLDRVRLGQLGEIHDQLLWQRIPLLALLHAEVDMGA